MFMRQSTRQDTGKRGEDAAVFYLRQNGYGIKARNYRIRDGEIDIIAEENDILVFVEVKTAISRFFGAPETWVDDQKQRRIGRAAQRYLMDNEIDDIDCRFDVIAVDMSAQPPRIKHIRDAFWLDE